MSRERRLCEGGCGRWLTDPVSIARKFGKRCAERLGILVAPPARRPSATTRRPPAVRTDPPVEHCPGQTELPLVDHQPTLWSI
ncbi:hypothetical protein JL475_00190 [Streptomyces sp. M2CJ-2]|uniref:hypothetical protein n=1 Tax=Streptomyces sp. M2CJ-2 TaxID=2803948 RepID=UPI001923A3B3|nr:hypothetical protein [Streptomyces sp. M2CJ-2]MBL3664464.1 hypothetical protein [Streptomyces sp. M2CJ-2]